MEKEEDKVKTLKTLKTGDLRITLIHGPEYSSRAVL